MRLGFSHGVMRFAWVASLVANWVEDDGFLRKIYVQVKTPNIYGDTTWYRGRVGEKTLEEKIGNVNLDITGVNQVGITTTQGRAEVVLPSKK